MNDFTTEATEAMLDLVTVRGGDVQEGRVKRRKGTGPVGQPFGVFGVFGLLKVDSDLNG